MKISAICGRGSKKDFIDLFFLLKAFSIQEIITFYQEKFHDSSMFLALKSLAYFGDADPQPQPKMFQDFDWELCKQKIAAEVIKL